MLMERWHRVEKEYQRVYPNTKRSRNCRGPHLHVILETMYYEVLPHVIIKRELPSYSRTITTVYIRWYLQGSFLRLHKMVCNVH